MFNRIINTYIVKFEVDGAFQLVKLHVTDNHCYIERFHKGNQYIILVTNEMAAALINQQNKFN